MVERALPLTTFYSGWDGFRQSLVRVIAPLTPEQLALPTASHHWTIGLVVQHILATRVWWFHKWMRAGNPSLAPIADWGWGEQGYEVGTAAELVGKLEATSQMIQEALAGWTPANLADIISQPAWLNDEERKMFRARTRQWIIWHVLEHEILHGGELSVALGSNGLTNIYNF